MFRSSGGSFACRHRCAPIQTAESFTARSAEARRSISGCAAKERSCRRTSVGPRSLLLHSSSRPGRAAERLVQSTQDRPAQDFRIADDELIRLLHQPFTYTSPAAGPLEADDLSAGSHPE